MYIYQANELSIIINVEIIFQISLVLLKKKLTIFVVKCYFPASSCFDFVRDFSLLLKIPFFKLTFEDFRHDCSISQNLISNKIIKFTCYKVSSDFRLKFNYYFEQKKVLKNPSRIKLLKVCRKKNFLNLNIIYESIWFRLIVK